MAGDPYSHVFPGQRLEISAASWNAAMDAAKRVNTALPGIGRAGTTNAREPDVILIRNDSGNDVPRYGVLGIEGVVFDHDDAADEYLSPRVLFKGVVPLNDTHEHKLAITLEQIPKAAIGRAVVSGYVQVQIVVNNEDDTHARLLNGYVDRLDSSNGNFPILFKEAGTGLKWGIVNLNHNTTIIIAQVNEAGGVDPSDATFAVDNVIVCAGAFGESTIAAVANTIDGTWDDDAWVVIAWNGTDAQWEATGGGGGASDGKVKVNVGDTLDYLEDQHYPVDVYDATYDLLLDSDTYSDAGDDKVILFIDASAISGWSSSAKQALIHDGATWKWMTIAAC